MTESGFGASPQQDSELEELLRAARTRVEFPPTPEIWPAIAADLIAPRKEVGIRHLLALRLAWPRSIRVLATSALILAVMALMLVAFPELRTAVAERLGLSGVIIRFIDEPLAPPAPPGAGLDLGRPVSLAEAEQAAGFAIRAPAAAEFGNPGAVYVTYGAANPMVSLVYPANERLPASRYTGVGALLTQFEGTVDGGMITKGIVTDSAVHPTSVDGEPAYWIDGAAHYFLYESPDGEIRNEEYRLAGNVLLWEAGGITYRLESELTEQAAIAVAESMRPIGIEEVGTE